MGWLGERIRLLRHHEVPGALDHPQLRVRVRPLQLSHVRGRDDPVLPAPHDEDRAAILVRAGEPRLAQRAPDAADRRHRAHHPQRLRVCPVVARAFGIEVRGDLRAVMETRFEHGATG